jgi:hypothetical protein
VQKLQIGANNSPNGQATAQLTERAIHHCSPQNSSPLGNLSESFKFTKLTTKQVTVEEFITKLFSDHISLHKLTTRYFSE